MIQERDAEAGDTSKPWVMITGCSGMIGTALMARLKHRYRLVGMDVQAPEAMPDGSHFIETDLTRDDSVARALKSAQQKTGEHLAAVVHLAAYYDFSGEPSDMYQRLTVDGTSRLIRGLRKLFQVDRFIFSSSLLVMKPTEPGGEPITEDSPLDAPWAYPQSKLQAEEVLRAERGEIPVTMLRIAGVYNDWCRCLPIGQQIRRIDQKTFESRFFPGDPAAGNPFVHLDDVVDCVERVIERRKALDPEEVYLVAEPEVASYEWLQDRIGQLLHGRQWPTIRVPKAVAKAGAWAQEHLPGAEESFIKPWMVDIADQHYAVSIDRARQRLDWQPQHRLPDELPAMIEKLKQHRETWYERNGLADEDDADEGD